MNTFSAELDRRFDNYCPNNSVSIIIHYDLSVVTTISMVTI